jgi:ubiquinone/menaquinone biosynthesis C-methylase UbiE
MKDSYKYFSKFYDSLIEPLNSGLRAIGMKMLPPKSGMKVLDIGCGTGAHLVQYQKVMCQVFGVDTSPSMLKRAQLKLGERADLRLVNASTLRFPDNHFDIILLSTVLHEMAPEMRIKVLTEARRVLKESGRILIIDFHPGPLKPIKGWIYKIIINIAEFAAGREHFKNSRQYLATGGIPALIDECKLKIEDYKIVSGGNFGIFIIK